jgi:FtsZ-binding cell division protein ZapB
MFAQKKGIANKKNYEIQIDNGNVLMYVHEVKFSPDKIKTAIEIVENLKMRVDELHNDSEEFTITKEVLDSMNRDFTNYVTQKNTMITLLKDYSEKATLVINELKLPSIDAYLSTYYASSSNVHANDKTCGFCGKTVLKSLAQHYRYCSKKRDDFPQQIESVQLITESTCI